MDKIDRTLAKLMALLQKVSALLLIAMTAGFIPGLLMALSMMLLAAWISRKRNYPTFPKASFKSLRASFVRALPALLMPLILMCGFLKGFMTPTESACIAVVYAAFLGCFFFHGLSFRKLFQAFEKSALLCSSTMLIVSCASAFGLVITEQQIPQKMAEFFTNLSDSPQTLLILLCVMFLIIGCFLETTSVFIILTPVLMTVVQRYGLSLIHFGVLEVIIVTVGLYTPPVGVGMFLTCKVAHISTKSFLKEIWPFWFALIAVCVLLIFVPQLVTALPDLWF